MLLLPVVTAVLLSQAPTDAAPVSSDPAERAAKAAERAADAAQRAAEAAAKAADAAQRVSTAAATETTAEKKEDAEPTGAQWTGSLGAGLISFTGNSETLTFSLNGALERKTENWIYAAMVAAAYGQATTTIGGPSDVVALNAQARLRGDRRFTEHVSAFLAAGLETDHVKSVEYNAFGEVGSGIIWIERKQGDLLKTMLRTDLALRYGNEARFQYYPTPADVADVTLVAPRLGVAFRYALTPTVVFTEDVEALLNVVGASRVLATSTTKLSAGLNRHLSFGVGFQVRHDSTPATGKKPTDTALTVGIEATL